MQLAHGYFRYFAACDGPVWVSSPRDKISLVFLAHRMFAWRNQGGQKMRELAAGLGVLVLVVCATAQAQAQVPIKATDAKIQGYLDKYCPVLSSRGNQWVIRPVAVKGDVVLDFYLKSGATIPSKPTGTAPLMKGDFGKPWSLTFLGTWTNAAPGADGSFQILLPRFKSDPCVDHRNLLSN